MVRQQVGWIWTKRNVKTVPGKLGDGSSIIHGVLWTDQAVTGEAYDSTKTRNWMETADPRYQSNYNVWEHVMQTLSC